MNVSWKLSIDNANAMANMINSNMTNSNDNIIAEIDYQDLIQKIKAKYPQSSTDIFLLIEEITGTYHYRIYQIVCTLDPDLKAINNKLSSIIYFFNYVNNELKIDKVNDLPRN